jgi:hypothetical protein
MGRNRLGEPKRELEESGLSRVGYGIERQRANVVYGEKPKHEV